MLFGLSAAMHVPYNIFNVSFVQDQQLAVQTIHEYKI